MTKTQKEKEKNVQIVLREIKSLVKKHGYEVVASGFNRYIGAVRTLRRLKANASKAEAEVKKFLGKTKI